MTRYEQGFLTKCAEYGVDGRELLYKQAVKLPKLPKYSKDQLYKIIGLKGLPEYNIKDLRKYNKENLKKIIGLKGLPEYNPLKGIKIKDMPELPEYNPLKGIKIKDMPELPKYNIKDL